MFFDQQKAKNFVNVDPLYSFKGTFLKNIKYSFKKLENMKRLENMILLKKNVKMYYTLERNESHFRFVRK